MQEVFKKCRFKAAAVAINSPEGLQTQFADLGFKFSFNKNIKSTNTLVFINSRKEFLDFLTKHLQHVQPDSVLWFAYPKGTSGIKTDINRDSMRIIGEMYAITTVSAISIDETWSALRFRPVDKVGK